MATAFQPSAFQGFQVAELAEARAVPRWEGPSLIGGLNLPRSVLLGGTRVEDEDVPQASAALGGNARSGLRRLGTFTATATAAGATAVGTVTAKSSASAITSRRSTITAR